MNFIRSIIAAYWRFREYKQVLGFWASLNFIGYEILKIERLKEVDIDGYCLVLRTNTPDLKVAIRSLFLSEFDTITLENVSFIIDAGAYIGTSAIFFSKKFPDAKIIAIEPEYGNYEILQKNTALYENIIPLHAALWSSNELRKIKDRNTGHWGYAIVDTFNETTTTNQQIQCTTVDELLVKYKIQVIDILKLDVEGSEKEILENSSKWIDSVRVLSAELHDRIIAGCEQSFHEATEKFSRFETQGEKITAYK